MTLLTSSLVNSFNGVQCLDISGLDRGLKTRKLLFRTYEKVRRDDEKSCKCNL